MYMDYYCHRELFNYVVVLIDDEDDGYGDFDDEDDDDEDDVSYNYICTH